MPFLVDSVSAEISQQGRSIRVVIHPRFWVKRDAQGELIEILEDANDTALIDELLINLSPIYFNKL